MIAWDPPRRRRGVAGTIPGRLATFPPGDDKSVKSDKILPKNKVG